MTNKSVRPSGIYRLTLKTWAFYVGLSDQRIHEVRAKFEADDKIRYDIERGVVWVIRFLEHKPEATVKHGNTVRAIMKDLAEFSSCSFIEEFKSRYITEESGGGEGVVTPSIRLGLVRFGSVRLENLGLDHKAFIDGWCQEYEAHFGKPYMVQGGKDGSLVRRLLQTFGPEELARRRALFFESSDPFILRAGFTIGVFFSQVNKLGLDKGAPASRAVLERKYGPLKEWAAAKRQEMGHAGG